MLSRSQMNQPSPDQTDDSTAAEAASLGTLTDLMATRQQLPGRHRAPVATPRIPLQALPTHDTGRASWDKGAIIRSEPDSAPGDTATSSSTGPAPDAATRARAVFMSLPVERPATGIPDTARWRASHLPRTVAAATLVMAVLGTSALGVRYAQTRASDDLVSLAIGLGVVVVLWAVVIASTPQVVSLRGSVLTVHRTGGEASFDLADALQPVDVVGNARTSHWAVLLHRPNSTTVVLRRNDVTASELDPIVRHYRMVAEQRHIERDARFNL